VRFLNKFYSIIKSAYLNDSRFSNNLRHTLRIFFEREVKTKYTPSLFGTVFKGSKWVDYKTFNINKLLIKTGLSYFSYILLVIVAITTLLGRSKAEQYFGFFPLFSYINFFMGYIPLVLHDVWSQILFVIYILYLYSIHLSSLILTSFSNLFFQSLSNGKQQLTASGKPTNPNRLHQVTTNVTTLTGKFNPGYSSLNTLYFSKTLNFLNTSNISLVTVAPNFSTLKYIITNSYQQTHTNSKYNPIIGSITEPITKTETYYTSNTCNLRPINTPKNLNTNLNTLAYISKRLSHLNSFDFNINQNLQSAKQGRWLIRNSLLSEALINNTFAVTQAKKIIGLGTLDKDLSSKSLWLPTKISTSSALETSQKLNYFLNNFTSTLDNSYLNSSNFNKPNFTNLNFFENSRYWLFKKYFFTNQQLFNTLVVTPSKSQSVVNKPSPYTNTLLTLNAAYGSWGTPNNNLHPSTTPARPTPLTKIAPASTNTQTFLSINTTNLDVFMGKNTVFFAIVTSNPQNLFFVHTNTTTNNQLTNSLKGVGSIFSVKL